MHLAVIIINMLLILSPYMVWLIIWGYKIYKKYLKRSDEEKKENDKEEEEDLYKGKEAIQNQETVIEN